MSRIGKLPVAIPQGVKAIISGQLLKVEGPKGKLERELREEVQIKEDAGNLILERKDDSKPAKAFHGMERALVNNMVEGVSVGFVKELNLIGVGYKADISGNKIVLNLGYSHPIDFMVPDGVKASMVKEGKDTFIKLESANKQLVGQVAAQIRSLRPPEPYKGKGVRYRNEYVRRKAGKAGKAA